MLAPWLPVVWVSLREVDDGHGDLEANARGGGHSAAEGVVAAHVRAHALSVDPDLQIGQTRRVLGSWAGVQRPFHLSLFLTASRMVLPQDPSTSTRRTITPRGKSTLAAAATPASGKQTNKTNKVPQPFALRRGAFRQRNITFFLVSCAMIFFGFAKKGRGRKNRRGRQNADRSERRSAQPRACVLSRAAPASPCAGCSSGLRQDGNRMRGVKNTDSVCFSRPRGG